MISVLKISLYTVIIFQIFNILYHCNERISPHLVKYIMRYEVKREIDRLDLSSPLVTVANYTSKHYILMLRCTAAEEF